MENLLIERFFERHNNYTRPFANGNYRISYQEELDLIYLIIDEHNENDNIHPLWVAKPSVHAVGLYVETVPEHTTS